METQPQNKDNQPQNNQSKNTQSNETRSRKPASTSAKSALDPCAEVINKYAANGWTVIVPPRGALNDIITQKGKKMHFVQVTTKETITGARYQGIARNTFIQNAFSNAAIPVYATVTITPGRGTAARDSVVSPRAAITFEDINQNSKLIITAKTPRQTDAAQISNADIKI